MYLLSFYYSFYSVFVMRFIHEPLARILRAASIPRYDLNELIDNGSRTEWSPIRSAIIPVFRTEHAHKGWRPTFFEMRGLRTETSYS